MCPPSYDTIGGAEILDTANETIGPKADEASPAAAVAPTSPTSRPLAASAFTVLDLSKRGAEEAGHSVSAQTIGSRRRTPFFPSDPSEEQWPAPSVPSTTLIAVVSSTSSPSMGTSSPTKEGSAGAADKELRPPPTAAQRRFGLDPCGEDGGGCFCAALPSGGLAEQAASLCPATSPDPYEASRITTSSSSSLASSSSSSSSFDGETPCF
jgi:hypothetical protein